MSKRRPSPWVPLSVYYYDDDALMEAGEFAEVMFTRMMAYAGRHRDWNGCLPRAVVLSRLGLCALENVPESAPEVRLEKLLETGLVTASGSRIRIEGWLKWNEPGEAVETTRDRDRQRKIALTRLDAEGMPEDAEDLPEDALENVPETVPESVPEIRTLSSAQEKIRREVKKSPSADADALFDRFWSVYPKKVSKQDARKRWDVQIRKTDPEVIITGAERYAVHTRGTDRSLIKNPDGWINGQRWNDEVVTGPPPRPARPDHAEQPFVPLLQLHGRQPR